MSDSGSPYAQNRNVTSAYKTNNPYTSDDAYSKKLPYEKNEDSGFGICSFWFDMKVKMQELMSSDIGLQEEERLVTMDTDPFKIMLAIKLTSRSFGNLLHIPFIVAISYMLYISADELMRFAIIVVDIMYLLWILWCPGHQTFTSGAFAIHKNSINLYKNWRLQFKFYQSATIFSFVLGTMLIAGISYFHEPYNMALHYLQMGFDYINYPVQLEEVSRGAMQEAAMAITIVNGIGVLGYFIFVSYLTERAKKIRAEYRKTNIINRTASILEQKRTRLNGTL